MGVDVRGDLNTYISSLEVDLSRAGITIRRAVLRLLGAHNLYHYRLTVSNRAAATESRIDFALKDNAGDKITKCECEFCKCFYRW